MSASAIWLGIAIGLFGFIALAAVAIVVAAIVITVRKNRLESTVVEVRDIESDTMDLSTLLQAISEANTLPGKSDGGADRNNIRGS